ncbi:hypothetical protein ACJX0J_029347, partial [Zea mays]
RDRFWMLKLSIIKNLNLNLMFEVLWKRNSMSPSTSCARIRCNPSGRFLGLGAVPPIKLSVILYYNLPYLYGDYIKKLISSIFFYVVSSLTALNQSTLSQVQYDVRCHHLTCLMNTQIAKLVLHSSVTLVA